MKEISDETCHFNTRKLLRTCQSCNNINIDTQHDLSFVRLTEGHIMIGHKVKAVRYTTIRPIIITFTVLLLQLRERKLQRIIEKGDVYVWF